MDRLKLLSTQGHRTVSDRGEFPKHSQAFSLGMRKNSKHKWVILLTQQIFIKHLLVSGTNEQYRNGSCTREQRLCRREI